jgi:uncharacterized protein (UPF0179 family)
MNYNTCRFCRFKKDCLNLENNNVKDCLFWREENEYDNGEEQ